MRIAKLAAAPLALAGWMAFAFSPRDSAPAGPPGVDHAGLPVTPLAGRTLSEGEHLALPTAIAPLAGHLILVDRYAERPLHVLRAKDGALVASLGRRGEGPGEFQVPSGVEPVHGEAAFWVFDAGLQRLTRVELGGEGLERPPWERRTLSLRVPGTLTGVVSLSPQLWLGAGLLREGRLARLDGEGRYQGAAGTPPPDPRGVPHQVLLHAWQGTLKAAPDRSRLVLVARHAGFLELYDGGGTLLRRVPGPFPFEPHYDVRPGSRGPAMASGAELRFGYLDAAFTGERIYTLFSGRTRAGHPGRAHYGEHVHIFDRDGTFLEVLRLDVEAVAIAVDGERLYAVRHLPLPGVVAYGLTAPR